MSFELNRIPDKLVEEYYEHNGNSDLKAEELIRKAYEDGLTLGLAAAHDKYIYSKVVEYITESERSEHGNPPSGLHSEE